MVREVSCMTLTLSQQTNQLTFIGNVGIEMKINHHILIFFLRLLTTYKLSRHFEAIFLQCMF